MTLVTGLIPNAPTDAAASTTNQERINAVLRTDGFAEIPAGVFTLKGPGARLIGCTDNSELAGAGISQTTLRAMSGSPLNQSVVANDLHDDQPHDTPNRNILIRDMTVDGNSGNRTTAPNPNSAGVAVTLRCVWDSTIRRVRALNGDHSFDISASVYMPNDLATTDPAKRPPGPSMRVRLEDCEAGGSSDDAFTTHCSDFTVLERCRAINHESKPRTGHSNGFEIDDGSRYTTLIDCYARGFSAGFAAKGHPQNIPAQWTTFIRCHAEWCRYGHWHFWEDHLGADGFAYGVVMQDCSATDLGDVLDYDTSLGYAYHPACNIGQYDGIVVDRFNMFDSATSHFNISGGATNYRVNGVTSTDCWTRPYQPQSRGVINVTSTAGANGRISNSNVRSNGRQRVTAVNVASDDCLVEGVQAVTAPLNHWEPNRAYELGEYVYTVTDVVLAVVKAGTSGATQPNTPAMNTGIDDGTVRWVRVYGAAVILSKTDSKVQARQITQVNHKYAAVITSGTSSGKYTGQPPAPDGWWK